MADEPTRQHYRLATGKGLQPAPKGPDTLSEKGGSSKGTKKGSKPR